MNNDAENAFDTLKKLWALLSLPECRDGSVTKTRKEQVRHLLAFLKQEIPHTVRQQRARSEIPSLQTWFVRYFSPSVHGRYPNGRQGISSSVGKSLYRVETTLRDEYLPKTEQEQLARVKTDAKRRRNN